jgi:23S rRNA (uracil1939-C5)-methyltransferase
MAFLPRITDWLGRWRLVRPSGPIKLIDVREAADERCHLTLLLECEPDRAPALPVDDLAGRLPELCGVSVSFNPLPGSFALGRSVRTVWGNGTFLAGVPAASAETRLFEVPAAGFFQVAPSQLPALHSIMAEHLGSAGTLFDLYCGVGVHGLSLAEAGPEATLIGIEESPAAAACARRNAHRLGIEARIVARKVEDVLARLVEETPPARVVLNPGPAGCQECVLDALAPVPDRRMVYHACDSVSLARDLAALVGRGWGVVRVVPVDMLPQTTKVEALALLDPVPHRC